MTQLSIKGHPTRGNEVIEILEMLGGKNLYNYRADYDSLRFYIGKETKIIYRDYVFFYQNKDSLLFTLEEFMKKFPYKIGDKVFAFDNKWTIVGAVWDGSIEEVVYTIKSETNGYTTTKLSNQLQPYKEETIMENKPDLLQQLKDYFDNTPREVVEKEWREYDKYNEIGPTVDEYLEYVNKIRQPQYPKTFVECCEILYPNENFQTVTQPVKGHNGKKLFVLQKLLICRDAYWKIAGEQMGLDKPWEYDMSKDEFSYAISYQYGYIQKNEIRHKNSIFVFPAAEMRDAFKENFDDDIDICKEFL